MPCDDLDDGNDPVLVRVNLSQLNHLLMLWQKRNRDYNKSVFDPSITDRHALARYEGIATATRWCIEDLQKILQ